MILHVVLYFLRPNIPQIPLGVSIAATIRVGNELGAGRPKTAKRAAYVTVGIGGT